MIDPKTDPLLEQLTEVGGKVDTLAGKIDAESKSRKDAIRWTRWAIGAAVLVAVLGVVVGTVGVVVAAKASDRANEAATSASRAARSLAAFREQTQIARVASCNNSNLSEVKQANAEKLESHDFVAALIAGSSDPAVLARARTFNDTHDRLISDAHELRDCSAAGIRKYLNQQQNQP